MIFTGGTLIFISATTLLIQLWNVRGGDAPESLKFYITGMFYLLVGIIIGTGLFLNWSDALYIKVPLEAHIHANSWGFMSLVFAGLLVDFVPMITGRLLSTTKNISLIYWGMTFGAFGLVLGPWLGGSLPPTVSGLVLHLSSTIWMVVMMIRAFKESGKLNNAGAWHLVSSYAWIIAPIGMAPFIMFGIFEAGPIESTAPQALIYGWVCNLALPSSHTLPAVSSSRRRLHNSAVVGEALQRQQRGVCLCGQASSSSRPEAFCMGSDLLCTPSP